MLNLESINITFNKGLPLERTILQDLNLNIKKGEFVVIVGENGVGKSTLFDIITGTTKPNSGYVKLNGKEIMSVSRLHRTSLISRVMQDPKAGTMENMTIFENMAFAYRRGYKRGLVPFTNIMRKKLFQEKLRLLEMGLENRLDERVINLSGGQRQALSLIMAITTDLEILLLDEITAALDPQASENIMRLANRIVREGSHTCIMITHNMLHARSYGDRRLVLKDGQLAEFSELG